MAKYLFLVLTLVLLFASLAQNIQFDEKDLASDETLWSLYEKWHSHHGIVRDLDEKMKRFDAFKENARFVHESNKEDATYKLALNEFGDTSDEEFINKYTGVIDHPGSPKDAGDFTYESAHVPDSVDWRKKGAVTAVKR